MEVKIELAIFLLKRSRNAITRAAVIVLKNSDNFLLIINFLHRNGRVESASGIFILNEKYKVAFYNNIIYYRNFIIS